LSAYPAATMNMQAWQSYMHSCELNIGTWNFALWLDCRLGVHDTQCVV